MLATQWDARLVREDLHQLAYRIAIAVPRISAWANGAKVPVRAGLFVSRAKSLAAYAIMLDVGTQQAMELVKQLNAPDPTRADYRAFIQAVVSLLEMIDLEKAGQKVEVGE